MKASLLRITMLGLVATGRVCCAQQAPPAIAVSTASAAPMVTAPLVADDSLAAAVGTSYLDKTIRGFGRAETLGPDGKTHFVWIPVNLMGFSKYLPFHRHEEDLKRFGREPFSIDVDKVQSIKVNGLYQEHMVLNGKRKHLIATRLVNGPVELFNYTEMSQPLLAPVAGVAGATVMGTAGLSAPGLSGFPDRQWFLRRPGEELVKVGRGDFVAQMTAYFHDDPELLSALNAGQLHYRDMVKIVQGYNEYRTRPAAR
ncbi:hypothetical protein [Hymenobacter siberiensis]|uniref:hypothetical protein n=1 Tax=Hymenobacter siberiensis TaxID=2848396 RepID=UPI001C1E2E1F|nr:hypothetical protein [Hymenobacter siberiensis]MBU6123062.1 hypothetical protein [Hymenobacter siberiensis]